MSIFNSFRTGTAEFLNAVSPVKLFQMNQARKLGADLGMTAFPRVNNLASRWKAMGTNYPTLGEKAAAWWAGHGLEYGKGTIAQMTGRNSAWGNTYREVASKRALYRRATVGLLGSATVGTLVFGRDNLFSEVGSTAATAGGVGLGAAGLLEWGAQRGNAFGKIGAAGLVGWSALNAYRAGDNWGPF